MSYTALTEIAGSHCEITGFSLGYNVEIVREKWIGVSKGFEKGFKLCQKLDRNAFQTPQPDRVSVRFKQEATDCYVKKKKLLSSA